MFVCSLDGVVYDRRRDSRHGLPDGEGRLICPARGGARETKPKEPPHRIFFCSPCGTTFDREQRAGNGLAYHLTPVAEGGDRFGRRASPEPARRSPGSTRSGTQVCCWKQTLNGGSGTCLE